MERLELPGAARGIWKNLGREIAQAMTGWDMEPRFGGGSILAARWNHRVSYDVDLFLPAKDDEKLHAFIGDDRVQAAIRREGATSDVERLDFQTHWTILIEGSGVRTRKIDVTTVERQPPIGHETGTVDGTRIVLETNAQILQGKLSRDQRGPRPDGTERRPTAVGLRLARSCAGWPRPAPTMAEFVRAVRTETPTRRDLAILYVWQFEATDREVWRAHGEELYTWHELAAACHRSGIRRAELYRELNMHSTWRGNETMEETWGTGEQP